MEVPEAFKDPKYIEKKRNELRIFFQDAKLPKEMIDKAIENELRPLIEGFNPNKPYISASNSGEVKSEYEVMTGQPFTKVDDHNKPLTLDEIKVIFKDNPIIAEKAHQIQIIAQNESFNKQVPMPLNEINMTDYTEMRKELDEAKGDKEKINNLNYKNMLALMTSVSNYKSKCARKSDEPISENSECAGTDSDEKEYDAIEKVVSQYTTKSYETRYQETKDMLLKMADNYDEPESSENSKVQAVEIKKNPVLKESSVQLIKGQRRRSAFDEVREKYAINEAMNIPLKDNPVMPDLSGISKNKTDTPIHKEEEIINVEDVFPKSFEAKLKDTERALRDINSVLNDVKPITPNVSQLTENQDTKENMGTEETKIEVEEVVSESIDQNELKSNSQKFDEKMERTLQNALENIYESTSNSEIPENNEAEFKEMKNLARNIVEGAENLSTLIREDITNKLNSMNELLNDVNEALENSRKSNIVFQKIKEEGEMLRRDVKMDNKEQPLEEVEQIEDVENVSDPQMDNIHDAISKLNSELKCHEERINQSKVRYEQRNSECKTFIKEVDEILLKSHEILHPVKHQIENEAKANNEQKSVENKPVTEQSQENGAKARKELWDVDLSCMDEKNKKMSEYKTQELERSKRINNLLYNIKDKMSDNKDVLRLANNLLRREETRKQALSDSNIKIRELPTEEIDMKAQGDHIEVEESQSSHNKSSLKIADGIVTREGKTEALCIN